LVTIMFYLKMPIPFMFNIMVISTALAALVCMATFVIKISVHAVVAAGFAGILLNLANIGAFDTLMVPALIAIVLAGLVMSSRLFLNAHTLSEVGWGGVLGFTVGYIGVTLLF
jgi:membrane-associated phospholipid phosphatase